jgi:fermentation-respiration switch protein FrsA (DUF1100 family)
MFSTAASTSGVPAEEIVLFGESLGSAVATDLALREPAAGLVLESAFPSVRALGRLHYPFLPGNLYDFLSHRYDTGEKIGRVSLPVLVIHGTEDDIVPVRMGRALYNDLPFAGGQRYFERLADFARETTGQ